MAYSRTQIFLLSVGLMAALPVVSAHAIPAGFGNASAKRHAAAPILNAGFTQNIMSTSPPSSGYQQSYAPSPQAAARSYAQPSYSGQGYAPQAYSPYSTPSYAPQKGSNWVYPSVPQGPSMWDRLSPFNGVTSGVPSMETVDGYADRVVRYGEKLGSGSGAVDRASSLAYIEREPTTWHSSGGYRAPMR